MTTNYLIRTTNKSTPLELCISFQGSKTQGHGDIPCTFCVRRNYFTFQRTTIRIWVLFSYYMYKEILLRKTKGTENTAHFSLVNTIQIFFFLIWFSSFTIQMPLCKMILVFIASLHG